MRILILAGLVGLSLAAAGCSKSTQEKAGQDLKAVGTDVGAAAKDVANAPAAKALGSDIKQGTQEAAEKTKEAASEAGDKLKAGASDAGDKLKAGAKDAGAKTDEALNKAKDKAEH
jgi:hypothetical protein